MKTSMQNLILATLISGLTSAAPIEERANRCKEVKFTVSANAKNRDFTGVDILSTVTNLGELIANNAFGLIDIGGTETIYGTYCEPSVQNENNDKLQFLVSTITSNRDAWDALGGIGTGEQRYQPEKYSWIDYANGKGYATLAIDKLGNGKSSRPDPILAVQGPYETALYHEIVKKIRGGTTGQFDKTYNHLIWVGHSYGSTLGTINARDFPEDFNEFILTGFSNFVYPSLPGLTLQTPLPAAVARPLKFLGLPLGYLYTPVEATRTDVIFGSPRDADWDQTYSRLNYQRADVISVGQFLSTYLGTATSDKFNGRVIVLTGEQDQAYCGLGSPVFGPAKCGDLLKNTGALFPAADYNWQGFDRTGHTIQGMKKTPLIYEVAHRFLAGESFKDQPLL